jgi:hypothetical protein
MAIMAKIASVPQSIGSKISAAGVTGALFAAVSVLVFLIDVAALRPYLPAARLVVVGLWALRFSASE